MRRQLLEGTMSVKYTQEGWFEIRRDGKFWDYRFLSAEDLKKIANAKKHKWELYPDY